MVLDPPFQTTFLSSPRFENTFPDQDFRDFHHPESIQAPTSLEMSFSGRHEDSDSPEDCDFSDEVLRFISQMLMEEDMEDKTSMIQNSLDLQLAEKSFYDCLGEKYPPSIQHYPTNYYAQNYENPNGNVPGNFSNCVSSSSDSNSYLAASSSINNISGEYSAFQEQNVFIHSTSQSSFGYPDGAIKISDGPEDSANSALQARDLYEASQPVWQFKKGIEEASKFLPSNPNLFVNLDHNGLLGLEPEGRTGGDETIIKVEKKDDEEYSPSGSRGKKNPYSEEMNLEEERSSKQPAVYTEPTLESKMSDMVLLCYAGQSTSPLITLQESLQNGTKKNEQQNGQEKGSIGRKARGKKRNVKKEVVDLRTLLILCAQAVAANDRRTANELLKQIRQHASLIGDGNQRLAHCFADGLEARLAGTGSQIYKGLISKKTFTADILKAYHLYLAACPFRKVSNFFSNRTIMNVAANSMRLHIIDFGILYGFQWPTFFQRISSRAGGPPKVRITAIEFPQPGFRPAELVEDTGRRIAVYAERFKVPFEYNAIAKKWETIQIEELKIDKNEVLAVNSLNQFQNLLDESVAVNSTRNIVLNMIRKINPDVFVLGVINGTYNAPFFVTRFREALFHFSSIFDMLETNVPREHYERMLLEREIFGKKALNVIACEGWERVERPETYKQWQVRQLRAGFRQLSLDKEITKMAKHKVNSGYHKDFVIDEDGQWLLQGWKGRTLYALSTWKPV